MSARTVLVVDDEKDIRDLLEHSLTRNGFRVTSVPTGEDALREARRNPPDLVLLDLMLPGVDGLDVCKALKGDERTSHVPVVMLTARSEESDQIVGLELGADDYIAKPFSTRVLLARVRAVLRRDERAAATDKNALIEYGPLRIDRDRHEVFIEDNPIALTALEMRILCVLVRAPGRVFTRHQIVEATQGTGVGVTDRSVDVHIVSLRRKLGAHAELIETVRGVGYRFRELKD